MPHILTPQRRARRSWGDKWGEKGFFRVRILPGDGVCGINKNPSVVLSSHYSKSSLPMSTSPNTDEGIGVQYICAAALGVMAIVSLILGCGCGESQPETPNSANLYTKSPAFLYGAVDRLQRRREDDVARKGKVRMALGERHTTIPHFVVALRCHTIHNTNATLRSSPRSFSLRPSSRRFSCPQNISKASPRWLGGGLGVYQNIDSTPPDSRGGTPGSLTGRGERTRSEDEESGLLRHHMRANSFGHLGDNSGAPSGVQPPDLTGTMEKKGKKKAKKKKKKKKLQMGIGFVPGGLGGKGLIDSSVSIDKGSPSPTFN